jgi:nucleoside-diphosphate-sugar epimerase
MTLPAILVTGAGGFIGGWVTEALHLAGATNLRAGVGRWASCARIARFPVEIRHCDVMVPESLDGAMTGIEVVIHCAHSRTDSRASIIEGTKHVLDRAVANGVKKVIHMSSVAVYGNAAGTVTEDTAPVSPVNPYGESKRLAEEVCRAASGQRLTVAVIRPTLVYGPFSELWTTPYIARILSGKWQKLGSAGEGKANLIYVGDLVRFAAHLTTRELPAYSVYNANGPEIPSFNEYFERLSVALGRGPLPARSERLGLEVAIRRPIRAIGKYALKNHRGLILEAANKSFLLKDLIKRTEDDLRLKPNDDEILLYGMDVAYSSERAKEIGFESRVSLEEGVAASIEWAKVVGLIG